MDIVAVIPARMGSSRLPGKPLCPIRAMPMVEHVYRRILLSESVSEAYVATPDDEIREAVRSFGGETIMTGSHERGTDRAAEAVQGLDADVVVIVHTDEPLITPKMIDDAVEPVVVDDSVDVTNVARPILDSDGYQDPNNVKVVSNDNGEAMYFSRSPIPHLHNVEFDEIRIDHQVCIVPIKRDLLLRYSQLEEGPLERVEGIDMLRLIEHGHDIRIVRTDRQTHSVDAPEDHGLVKKLMATDDVFHLYGDSNE